MGTDPEQREYISLQHAAARLDVSVKTLRRMVARGELPAYRFGARLLRLDADSLDRLARPVTSVA